MNLQDYAKKEGVKYFMISFTDLFGVQKGKTSSHQVRDARRGSILLPDLRVG